MSNPAPKGWVEHRQGDIVEISNGRAYKLTEWEKQGTPVIRLQNLTGSGKDYYYSNLKLPEHQYCDFGDLLYMWSATFGAHIWSGQKAIYHYHIWKITCDEINITKHYLYQLLGQKTAEWMNKSNGMGILHVTKGSMEEMALTLPPLPEQQKIASILTAVDDVIESTQAQINKLKDLKTGMMQELLTKGIGHTEFKDSPVGRIPKAWEIIDANSVCSKITKGTTPPKLEYVDDGKIPFLRVNNLHFDNKVHFENGIFFLSRSIQDKFLARSIVYPGDILMNIVGPPLGKIAIAPNDYPEYNINQAIIIYRTIKKKINNYFLLHYLTSNLAQDWFQVHSKKTSGQQNLTIELCKDLPIPLPSIEEQNSIVKMLDGIDSLLSGKVNKFAALANIKKSLMQDLLTGKVRVKVD